MLRGEDPKDVCPAGVGDSSACLPGVCDGAGDCLRGDASTVCRPGTCNEGLAVDPTYCNDDGICPASTTTACAPYRCEGDACGTSCEGDEHCDPERYCLDGACVPRKIAGVGCAQSNECLAGLTCLDGVCCTAAACPACRNCGANGTCNVIVAGEIDESSNACVDGSVCNDSGQCREDLGEACSDDGQCASGSCVDAVCCAASTCGACRNCGDSGVCDGLVTDQDDISGSCNGAQTCDAQAQCVVRWEVLGVTNVPANFYPEFTGTAGRDLYFANNSNSGGEQYFQSFDLNTGEFSDESLIGNEFCACGYSGMTVSAPDTLYYFGNAGVRYSPGDRAWSAVSGYAGDVRDGENVAVYLDGRIYRVGGREYPGRVSYFDIESDSWTIDGLSALSEDASQWCGGAADGRIYLFDQSGSTYEYTVASDSWVSLGQGAGTPPPCYGLSLHRWGDYLVTATDSTLGVALFDLGRLSWEPSRIPLPEEGLSYRALVAGGDLYLLGFDNFDDTVTVFGYRL